MLVITVAVNSTPAVEAKVLPQTRPPLVTAATAMAAMAAVSTPGI